MQENGLNIQPLGNIRDVFKNNLIELRGDRQMKEIATGAKIPYRTYQNMEEGVIPQGKTLAKIAAFHRIDSDMLFADPDRVATPEEAVKILAKFVEQTEKRERELSASARSIVDLLPTLDQAKLTDSLLTYVQSLAGTGPDPLEKGRALLGSDQPGKKRRDHRK